MTVGEITAKVRLDLSEFRAGLSRATALLEKSREVAMTTAAVLGGLGGGLVAGMATMTREAAAFEAQMRNVNSILKLSEADFEALGQSVLGLAGKTGKAPQDLARGLYDIASSGFSGAEGLKILESSAIAATAGVTDTATAVRVATGALNAYGMGADQVGHVQDVLFKTVERGVITYGELAAGLGEVMASAAQARVPLEEVGAAMATMTKAGIVPAEAMTSLNQLLMAFISPSAQAKAAAQKLGIDLSAGALAAKGLSGAMADLAGKLGTSRIELEALHEAGASDAEAMAIIAQQAGLTGEELAALFPEIRAMRGALNLAADGGRVFSEELKQMAQATGSAAAAFAEQSKSFAVQWDKAWATARAVMVQFGTSALPILKVFVGAMRDVASTAQQIPAPMRATLLAVMALTAAFTLATAAFIAWKVRMGESAILALGLTGAMKQMIAGLVTAAGGANIFTGAIRLLGVAISGLFRILLANPWVALITGVTALGVGIVGAFTRGNAKVREMNDQLDEMRKKLQGMGKEFPEAAKLPQVGLLSRMALGAPFTGGRGIHTQEFENARVAYEQAMIWGRVRLQAYETSQNAIQEAERKLTEFRQGATAAEIQSIERKRDADINAIELAQMTEEARAAAIPQVWAAAEADIIRVREAGSKAAIAGQARLLEAQGKAHEARLLQIRQESEEVAAAAYPDPKDKVQRAGAQARLYMADLAKLEKEEARTRTEAFEKQSGDLVKTWIGGLESMRRAGRVQTDDYINALGQVLAWIERLNKARGGEARVLAEQELQIAQSVKDEKERLATELQQTEKQLSDERKQWAKEEMADRERIYEAERVAADALWQYQQDRVKLWGEKINAQDWQDRINDILSRAEFPTATWSGPGAIKEGELVPPGVAEKWAADLRETIMGAFEAGVPGEDLEAYLSLAYDVNQEAAERIKADAAAAFDERRQQEKEATAGIGGKIGTLKDQIAGIGQGSLDTIKRVFDEFDNRLQRAFKQAFGSPVSPVLATAAGWGKITTEGPGPRITQFYYEGKRQTPSSKIRELMDQIADELDREKVHPRD